MNPAVALPPRHPRSRLFRCPGFSPAVPAAVGACAPSGLATGPGGEVYVVWREILAGAAARIEVMEE